MCTHCWANTQAFISISKCDYKPEEIQSPGSCDTEQHTCHDHFSVLGHAPISLYITTTNNHRQHRTMLLFSSERPATKAQLTGFPDLNSAHFKFSTSSESLDSESGCHWLEEGVVPVRLRWWQAVWWEGSVCWHRDSESLCCVFLSGRAWTSPSLSALKHQNQTHNIK